MDIDLVTGLRDIAEAPMLVLGAFADGSLTASAGVLPAETANRLSALAGAGEWRGAAGSQLHLFEFSATRHRRILLVGLGPRLPLREAAYRAACAAAARVLARGRSRHAVVALTEVEVEDRTRVWRIELAARLLADGRHGLVPPRDVRPEAVGADHISLVVPGEVGDRHRAAARRGLAIAEGVALAKDLADAPAGVGTPAFLGKTARAIGERFALNVEVFERVDLISLGMEALVAVGDADRLPSSLIVMSYRGGTPAAKPVVLVGEGLVVDAGGARRDGALDMCGAAALLGTMWAVARCGVSINLLGLAPTGMIRAGGAPVRIGARAGAPAGHADALVGRDMAGLLVMCDALSYARHLNPSCVIDVATLSGPAAGGHCASGLFANDAALADEILASGVAAGDSARRLAWPDDASGLAGARGAPAAEAAAPARLLVRFAAGTPWAHLDISATARGGDDGRATGRPVALLTTFLVRRTAKSARGRPAPPVRIH